jgi:oxygen-independent coproporphyrinogen-3 oxidase
MAQAVAPPAQAALGVYLHIPFCKTLCPYCDFVKVRDRNGVPEEFVDALLREIRAYNGPREARSVFFGGGTPSRLTGRQLARINDALREAFDFVPGSEWSLEANPDDISPDALTAMAEAGINRLSLGVQSFDDRVLRYLGRRHDAASALRAGEEIARHFDNWSLDLMFGAPPLEAWPDTLRTAVSLRAPHMSAYGLTYEEGTPFAKRARDATPDDVMLRMYQQLEEALGEYDHYEISNFAMPGRQAQHNLVYWHNLPYAGFGTGAYSYIGGIRARNATSLEVYLRTPGQKEEALHIAPHEEKLETLIQHLRLREGLPRARYAARFGEDVEAAFGPALERCASRGLVTISPEWIRPTAEGFYLNNEIGLELVG